MPYEITGTTKEGKKMRVVRSTKQEAERHARAAKAYGGKNVRIKKI